MSSETAISFRTLNKTFDALTFSFLPSWLRKAQVTVVHELSFDVLKGEIYSSRVKWSRKIDDVVDSYKGSVKLHDSFFGIGGKQEVNRVGLGILPRSLMN
jgi:hypothetical protein